MTRKIVLTVIVIGFFVALIAAYYLYTKPRAGVTGAAPRFTETAASLYSAFNTNEQLANQKYLNQVIQVSGVVETVDEQANATGLILRSGGMGGINCSFADKLTKPNLPAANSTVIVKGRCVGFMLDVNLLDCVLVNQ